jgi:hypothetical protein
MAMGHDDSGYLVKFDDLDSIFDSVEFFFSEKSASVTIALREGAIGLDSWVQVSLPAGFSGSRRTVSLLLLGSGFLAWSVSRWEFRVQAPFWVFRLSLAVSQLPFCFSCFVFGFVLR